MSNVLFEGYTLEQQRQVEQERGWKPTYAALTYCTAEAIIARHLGQENFFDIEILDAKRISGAPDCVGLRQGKWGEYVKPTDPSAKHAMIRGLKSLFDWQFDSRDNDVVFAGIIGPWVHPAFCKQVDSEDLFVSVNGGQAEKTPFEAKLFLVDADQRDLPTAGTHKKSTSEIRWIRLGDLVKEQGENPRYLYWSMIVITLSAFFSSSPFVRYVEPGVYNLTRGGLIPNNNYNNLKNRRKF